MTNGLTAGAHDAAAIANAIAQGKTSAEVRAMGYAEIAALANVTIAANGSSPATFIYQAVRNGVASQLEKAKRVAEINTIVDDIKTAMTSAGHKVTVTAESDKRVIVERTD